MNKITINVESLGNETVKANFTGGAENFHNLIQLGSAVLNTYLASATELIKKNDKKLEKLPDELIRLQLLSVLVDKIEDLIQVNKDVEEDDTGTTDNEKKVDEFLNNIINGLKGDE